MTGTPSFPPRFQPVRRLGKGGGGEVWAVSDTADGAVLAMKFLAPEADQREIDALVREASVLSGLEGLGVPRVLRFGRLPGTQRPYLLRELVEGQSLLDALADGLSASAALAAVADAADKLAGDTVRFVWTGVIAHTSTSDALSGSDVWNSGLLTEGAVYEVVITSLGEHPYYCIPHGGPGGIGMSGVINALPLCNCELSAVSVAFSVTNGSPNGYNVFIDGVVSEGSPFPYSNLAGQNEVIVYAPGNENIHTITVQDLDTPVCAATAFVSTPLCGAGCSVLNLSAVSGSAITHIVEVRDYDF